MTTTLPYSLSIILFLIGMSLHQSASAEPEVILDTQADLYNERLVESAREQIAAMQMLELDELLHYLASCGTRAGGQIKAFFCEQSARAYSLKFGQNKPVDRLIQAMSNVEAVMELVDAADAAGTLTPTQEVMKNSFFKDLDRYIVIKQMMETTTRDRYQFLLN